ncbi:MAG: HAD family hydrolase [Chloroflexi bacterium]|jgi:FMN phosphatase YigB (HAD superfamily)|nr:HAD family hydrolase [Chloroflexota bacterium]
MSSPAGHGARRGRLPLRALTFDFGNTLVAVDRAALEVVVGALADAAASRFGVDREAFLVAWAEERARQLREEIPRFREVDLAVRLRRVLARLRGAPAPSWDAAWDDAGTAGRSTPDEIDFGLDVYSRAFVAAIPPGPLEGALLARMASRYRVGILSNWPLAVTIDRYAEAAGWTPHLAAIVVSERVGVIKPHPAIFRAAEAALAPAGAPPLDPGSVLHVGDDWAADVVGATRAGWRSAYLRARPADSPLPASEPDGDGEPDLVLDRLADLERALETLEG